MHKKFPHLSLELELLTAFQDFEKLLHERCQSLGTKPPGKLPITSASAARTSGVDPGTTSPAFTSVLAGEGPNEGFTAIAVSYSSSSRVHLFLCEKHACTLAAML